MATQKRSRRSRYITVREQKLREAASIHGRRPQGRWGRPLRGRLRKPALARWVGRDKTKTTSDAVWGLVEKLLDGDESVLPVLDDVIEEGVQSGKTKFLKLTQERDDVHYAAVTPKRQIVLFGVKTRSVPKSKPGEPYTGMHNVRRTYISRYQIGDAAVHRWGNIAYTGKISSISDKRIMIQSYSEKKSLTLDRFNDLNWEPETIAKAAKHNREWTD